MILWSNLRLNLHKTKRVSHIVPNVDILLTDVPYCHCSNFVLSMRGGGYIRVQGHIDRCEPSEAPSVVLSLASLVSIYLWGACIDSLNLKYIMLLLLHYFYKNCTTTVLCILFFSTNSSQCSYALICWSGRFGDTLVVSSIM